MSVRIRRTRTLPCLAMLSALALVACIPFGSTLRADHPGDSLALVYDDGMGGTLPYLIGRLDHQTQVLKRGAEHITKPPSEYLRHIYLDAVSPLALAIRYGYDFVGPDRLLYASDHPWVDPKLIAGLIRSLKLPAADERKIFGENAKRLFNL